MSSYQEENPVNPLPPVVIALAVILVGVEIVFSASSKGLIGGPQAAGWRISMIEQWGFREPLFSWMVENGRYPLQGLARFLTYPFFHLNFANLLFPLVLLLALGKFVGEVFSATAILTVFFGAAAFGAIAYWLFLDTPVVLFGAYPSVYGLIGAFTYLLWTKASSAGANQLSAFKLIAFLMCLRLIWAILFGIGPTWISDLAGFIAGFGLSFVVSPGGWANLLARLRRR